MFDRPYYGFVGIGVELAPNDGKKHIYRKYTGEAAIKKLQKLQEKPVRCYLNFHICATDKPFSVLCSRINYAYLNEEGYPEVSFDFHNTDLISISPTYYLKGWGTKETKEVAVKEYHIKGDILKKEWLVKDLIHDGDSCFDVVLENSEIISKDSIRVIWVSEKNKINFKIYKYPECIEC